MTQQGNYSHNIWLTRYPVSLITPLLLLAPVLAVVLGVWVWGDQPTWKLLLGGLMTLVGVAIVTLKKSEKSVTD